MFAFEKYVKNDGTKLLVRASRAGYATVKLTNLVTRAWQRLSKYF